MAKGIYTINAIDENDLTKSSSSQKYPLGAEFAIYDTNSTTVLKKYIYVYAEVAAVANTPYMVRFSSVSGQEVQIASPATADTVSNIVCVAESAIDSGDYGFVLVQGVTEVAVVGTHTVNDYLELISAATQLTSNGTSGSSVYDDNAVAICASVSTGAEVADVVLLGKLSSVAAT
jgi:hypothetical protein